MACETRASAVPPVRQQQSERRPRYAHHHSYQHCERATYTWSLKHQNKICFLCINLVLPDPLQVMSDKAPWVPYLNNPATGYQTSNQRKDQSGRLDFDAGHPFRVLWGVTVSPDTSEASKVVPERTPETSQGLHQELSSRQPGLCEMSMQCVCIYYRIICWSAQWAPAPEVPGLTYCNSRTTTVRARRRPWSYCNYVLHLFVSFFFVCSFNIYKILNILNYLNIHIWKKVNLFSGFNFVIIEV